MYNPLIALLIGTAVVAVLLLLFLPERGLYWRWQQTGRLSQRILTEDALKFIHKAEMRGEKPTLAAIAGTLHISQNDTAVLLTHMQTEGLLTMQAGQIQLTPPGREAALHIIRAHRLWERHLAEETGYEQAEWHGQIEHQLSPAEVDALAERLGNPTHDPHGDPIPTASGEIVAHGGKALTLLPLDTPARIVHLEDEPELVYAQLAAEGLHPGMAVRVVEVSPERIRFWANGNEHWLAPMIAANISVVETETAVAPEPAPVGEPLTEPLTALKTGETGEVIAISPACRGAERRRFMDLGILRGAKITVGFRSPSGDPVAYQIRGATIALRREQAALISVIRNS
ncbi:MAG TPA: FeoA domain-containing protein [Chloroflexota bacterium]|nr:FeoA domain-containing protein [Chloroflexota bacterium]